MIFEDALLEYLFQKSYALKEGMCLSDLRVSHEDGWYNEDSGTAWPAEIHIDAKVAKFSPQSGKLVVKAQSVEFHVGSDMEEFMRALWEVSK